jgi:hypothetical protein
VELGDDFQLKIYLKKTEVKISHTKIMGFNHVSYMFNKGMGLYHASFMFNERIGKSLYIYMNTNHET